MMKKPQTDLSRGPWAEPDTKPQMLVRWLMTVAALTASGVSIYMMGAL